MTSSPIQDHSHSFRHAFAGIRYTLTNHSNLRIHLAAALITIILAIFLGLNPFHWAILIFTILLVIVCEMINTSLETLGDAITLDYHPSIKVAKDVSAGMVLISCLGAVLIGLIIFTPYLINYFS